MRLGHTLLVCFFLSLVIVNVYGQTQVNDGSSSQAQHSNEITAIIVTAVMCGLGLILCCTGICICCYVKCCTGGGCSTLISGADQVVII